MSIGNVSSIVLFSTPLKKKIDSQVSSSNEIVRANQTITKLPSFSTVAVISQMPNVNFGAKKYNYGSDDLSPYNTYSGPTPPEIEMKKYRLSVQIENYINEDNYLEAIKGKLALARICKSQGKDGDAFILEESIRRLYKDLPRYQRSDAKAQISTYNSDMAKYIDEDIKRI